MSTIEKILSFKKLEKGWHYGEGVPAQLNAIDGALHLYSCAYKLGLETDAFPCLDGEIMLCVYDGPHTFEFIVDDSGNIEFIHEIGDSEAARSNDMCLQDAVDVINAAHN